MTRTMAHNMTQADWCNRRDDLNHLSDQIADVLFAIGRIKGYNTEDERFFSTMKEIGQHIYKEYHNVLEEVIICNKEIDR